MADQYGNTVDTSLMQTMVGVHANSLGDSHQYETLARYSLSESF